MNDHTLKDLLRGADGIQASGVPDKLLARRVMAAARRRRLRRRTVAVIIPAAATLIVALWMTRHPGMTSRPAEQLTADSQTQLRATLAATQAEERRLTRELELMLDLEQRAKL